MYLLTLLLMSILGLLVKKLCLFQAVCDSDQTTHPSLTLGNMYSDTHILLVDIGKGGQRVCRKALKKSPVGILKYLWRHCLRDYPAVCFLSAATGNGLCCRAFFFLVTVSQRACWLQHLLMCVFLWAIAGLISTGQEKCMKPHLNVNEVLYLWQRAYITNVYFNKPISLCSEL